MSKSKIAQDEADNNGGARQRRSRNNWDMIFGLLKEFSGQANVVTIPRAFIAFMRGSLDGGLFLSQLIYWSDLGNRSDGFIYKSYREWKDETTLGIYEVRKHAKYLKSLGVLETKLKKANGSPTLHYRFKPEQFSKSFCRFLKIHSRETHESIREKVANPFVSNSRNHNKDYDKDYDRDYDKGEGASRQPSPTCADFNSSSKKKEQPISKTEKAKTKAKLEDDPIVEFLVDATVAVCATKEMKIFADALRAKVFRDDEPATDEEILEDLKDFVRWKRQEWAYKRQDPYAPLWLKHFKEDLGAYYYAIEKGEWVSACGKAQEDEGDDGLCEECHRATCPHCGTSSDPTEVAA
jgi:hypothetical protein